mgnify:CR=1 FL=1
MKQRIKTILYKKDGDAKVVCGTFSSMRKAERALDVIREQFGEEDASKFEIERLIEDETYLS